MNTTDSEVNLIFNSGARHPINQCLFNDIDKEIENAIHIYQQEATRNTYEEKKKESKEEEKKQHEEQYQSLVGFLKNTLQDKVKDVRISNRLTDSACCLVSDEYGMDVRMEKILRSVQQEVPETKRILEINPGHRLIQNMEKVVEKDNNNEKLQEYADVLYNQALLTAGLEVEDPAAFSRRISNLLAEDAAKQV